MWAFGINHLDLIPFNIICLIFLDKMLIKDTVIVTDNGHGQISINLDDTINKLKSMLLSMTLTMLWY